MHPDRDATGAAVIHAVKSLPKEKRPKVYCVAFSNNCEEEIGAADVVHDVTEVADIKLNTLKAHVSQTQLMIKEMEENLKKQDPAVMARINQERFWTYQFDE